MVERRPYTPEEAKKASREMGEFFWEEANEIAHKAFGDDLKRDVEYIDSLYKQAEICGCKNCRRFADMENARKMLEWKRPVEDDDNVGYKIRVYAPKPKGRKNG